MALERFRIGSAVFTAGSDIIQGYCRPTAVNNYDTMKVNGANYQVTAGKTFYIVKINISTSAVNQAALLGYGDTGVADAAGAPTNAIVKTDQMLATPTALSPIDFKELSFPIPAQKFPFVRLASGAGVFVATLWGFEA